MEKEMIKIKRKQPSVKLKTSALGNIAATEMFHFASLTFDEAMNEKAFYMVIQGGKDSRQKIVCLADGLVMERDDSHRVCIVSCDMVIGPK